ncbi:MAG: efflux RND transporter permease subunit, partial [Proteobacteria bacterium]
LYDRSELVNATLQTIEHNLVTGAVLVLVVLLLLVGNIRAAIITAITIPLSLLFTFILMKRFGISGNLMSLGALDFGIIVDGAVIVLENCVRTIHERTKALKRDLSRAEVQEAVYDAAIEIRSAAGFGELIIIVVFLPVFALVGIEGKMFIPMAATFSIAVFGALVLSFTTAPALASLFLSGKAGEKEPWLFRLVQKLYRPLLDRALAKPKRVMGIGVVSVLIGGVLFTRLGGEFLPQLDEGSLAVQLVRPVNTSIDQSVELQRITEKLISEFPEVKDVFSRIGTSEVATDPMGVNLADTYIMLQDRKNWPEVQGHRRNKEQLAQAILEKLEAEIPGQRALLSQPIQMRFNELLEGTRADVSVKVFGDDMKQLTAITRQVSEVIERVPGSGDVELELKGTSPLLRIIPKEGILAQLGVSSREVLETVEVALGGTEVGYLFEGVKRFPIVVRLSD